MFPYDRYLTHVETRLNWLPFFIILKYLTLNVEPQQSTFFNVREKKWKEKKKN